MEQARKEAFERLYSIIKTLRSPGGCPWDIEQTPLSLRETLIEESFETVEAINEQNPAHVAEEIGDVLLNATMLAYMYEESGDFTVVDALNGVADKLIRRHPHVFGKTEGFEGPDSKLKTTSAEKVLEQWDAIKQSVEGRKSESVLDSVSLGMPSLHRAYKLQKKAAKCGFDWPNIDGVWEKLYEEIDELKTAIHDFFEKNEKNEIRSEEGDQISIVGSDLGSEIRSEEGDQISENMKNVKNVENVENVEKSLNSNIEEELGDLLFATVNLARHLGLNPTVALARANEKFTKRFKYVEESMKHAIIPMDKNHLKEMDKFWNKAKGR